MTTAVPAASVSMRVSAGSAPVGRNRACPAFSGRREKFATHSPYGVPRKLKGGATRTSAAVSMDSFMPSIDGSVDGDFTLPDRMAVVSDDEASVEYRISLVTSNERDAGLNEPDASVLLTLVGENGAAFMHRISSFSDDSEGSASGFTQLRFQEGSVDDISFTGPDLGGVKAMWIAPEAGSWDLEEATVRIGGAEAGQRFICGRVLGEEGDVPAAELRPVPLDVDLPLGSAGKAAATRAAFEALSPDEKEALRAKALAEYQELKVKLLGATALLVGAGTVGAGVSLGDSAAVNFAAGGMGGIAYLVLLSRGVDNVGSNPDGAITSGLVSSPVVRLGVVAALVGAAIKGSGLESDVGLFATLLEGGLGFFMYKVAALAVGVPWGDQGEAGEEADGADASE